MRRITSRSESFTVLCLQFIVVAAIWLITGSLVAGLVGVLAINFFDRKER